jgi:hypothetical protein
VRGGGLLEAVEDQARLDDRRTGGGVQGQQAVHVAGEVENHARAGGLACDGGAAAARHDRHPVRPAGRQRRRHVLGVTGCDDAQGDAPVVGRVHGRQRPGRDVETDLAPDGPPQLCLKIRHAPSMKGFCKRIQNLPSSITNSHIVTFS